MIKIFENLKTDILILKHYNSFYPILIVKVVHMLSDIIILHMTVSGQNTYSCNALLPVPGTSISSKSLKSESAWGIQEGENDDIKKSYENFYDRSISKMK